MALPTPSTSALGELLKSLIGAGMGGMIGYLSGKRDHLRKTEWERRKLLYEQQVKAWQETVSYFPKYIVSRARLRDAAEAEHNYKEHMAPGDYTKLQERKERYLLERDAARTSLMTAIEQIRILFAGSSKLIRLIDDFEALESQSRVLSFQELPPEQEWKYRMSLILLATYESINQL